MNVNIAVSGRFHYHNYIRYIHEAGILNRFYYAHRISTDANALGVPDEKLVNIWIKEYLLQGHSRLPGIFDVETLKPFYRSIWEWGSLRHWAHADLLHIMLHGGGRKIINKAGEGGSLVIGEPVNAHPVIQTQLLNDEYERLKISRLQSTTTACDRIVEELSMTDRIIVASNFLKRTYVEQGYPADLIKVLPYGVDLARFAPVDVSESEKQKFRVICVAGISVRKGIIDLLEAWRLFGPDKGELILIGRVSDEMSSIIKPYESLFTHIPFVPNHELKKYLSASTVFVLPSIEDGFGLVCGEAMACKIPVIATVNTGAAELIVDDINGYVVPIRSPETILSKLEELSTDRDKARQMGANAEKKVRAMYNWRGYAEELIKFYYSIDNNHEYDPQVKK